MNRIVAGRRNPWLVFLLPFVVFMLIGSFEPSSPNDAEHPAADATGWFSLGISYSAYPRIYTIKIALTLVAMAYVWPGYRQFSSRARGASKEGTGTETRSDAEETGNDALGASPLFQRSSLLLAIGIGVIGTAVWVGLAMVQREIIAGRWGWDFGMGKRSAFDPLVQMAHCHFCAYTFLAIRFLGLVVVVSVIEEFFLRGFVMRFVVAPDWWAVPFGVVNRLAIVLGTAVPVLMHPQEALAAAVWFSAVTWLMLRTRNIWHCVAAHATTNLLLGLYVLASGNWWLM